MPLLPRVRPKPGSYGPAVENERPVRNAKLEADARDYNNARDDLAFLGAIVFVARVRVANDGTKAAIASSVGIDNGFFTATRLGVGRVRIELAPAAGVVLVEAGGWVTGTTPAAFAASVVGPSMVEIYTQSAAGPVDVAFTLLLF
jgi:hypothetical protein